MVSTYGWNYFYLCTYRRLEAITNTGKYFGLEASAWYWHSVDVVGCSYINGIFWASYENSSTTSHVEMLTILACSRPKTKTILSVASATVIPLSNIIQQITENDFTAVQNHFNNVDEDEIKAAFGSYYEEYVAKLRREHLFYLTLKIALISLTFIGISIFIYRYGSQVIDYARDLEILSFQEFLRTISMGRRVATMLGTMTPEQRAEVLSYFFSAFPKQA